MFQTIAPKDLKENVFSLLDDRWMLVTAGEEGSFNTMTASWGGFGVLFHKNVATIYIRPQRYTLEFLEKYDTFTLSFLEEGHRNTLATLGKRSGRDMDKMKDSGLTPLFTEAGIPYFQEANLVLCCKKLLAQDLDPKGFLDESIFEHYPQKDYHRMYIAEIETILMR